MEHIYPIAVPFGFMISVTKIFQKQNLKYCCKTDNISLTPWHSYTLISSHAQGTIHNKCFDSLIDFLRVAQGIIKFMNPFFFPKTLSVFPFHSPKLSFCQSLKFPFNFVYF